MAPLLELGDFKAWITCEGRRVEQFGIDHDAENNTVSCWIPGKAKAEFTVHWRCTDPEYASSGHVWIDGKDVSSAIIRAGNYGPVSRSGVKLKNGNLRPFTFAKLNLTDDDKIADPKDPTLADLGAIDVRISWVRLGSPTEFQGYEAPIRGLVHEKAKKLGAIHTVFGAATKAAKTRAVTTAPIDPENPGPHARFIFRYRTMEYLRTVGTAPPLPREPSTQDTEGDEEMEEAVDRKPTIIEIDSDSDNEERELPSSEPEPASPKRIRLSSEAASGGDAAEGEAEDRKPLFLGDEDEDMEEVRLDPDADVEEDDGTPAPPSSKRLKSTPSGRGAARKGNFFDEEDD